MGSGSIRDMLDTSNHEIIAADSSQERLARLPAHQRLSTRVLDVSDRSALMAALAECDLCVNAVPTFAGYQMAIFEACLEARRSYTDYGGMGVYTVKQKAMHQAFEQAGVTAVVGLGADPGLSNVICRAVADRLDSIEKINLYWTGVRIGPESPVLVPAYSLSTILSEYANPSMQFLDGELREVPARGGVETLDLPEPFGRTTFIFTQHSEPLTIPFAKGIAEKGIREFTWRLALPIQDHQAYVALARAGFGDYDTPVSVPGGTVKPLDVLQAVMERQRQRTPPPAYESHEIHFAVGVGQRQGHATRVTARVIGRPHPAYEPYADAATSMFLSIGVQQMLDRPLVPGVWAPEECFDPDAFLAEVTRRHFEVSIETVSTEAF